MSQAVITRMEIECVHCKSVIRLNVHRAEAFVVGINFATIVALASLAYWFQSRELVLVAFGAAMLGALALPLLEQTYLRSWPRYASTVRHPNP